MLITSSSLSKCGTKSRIQISAIIYRSLFFSPFFVVVVNVDFVFGLNIFLIFRIKDSVYKDMLSIPNEQSNLQD